MTEDEIRSYLGTDARVHLQVASAGDGSPEIAWGDTFVFARDQHGQPRKMPFVTIVTKDYDGFDSESRLNRGGLFRLNIDVGKSKFQELCGFAPSELEQHRETFDFAALGQLFPHPTYGVQGWVSIINPSEQQRSTIVDLLELARSRAVERRTG